MANQVAYGFNTLVSVMGRRVTEVGAQVVWNAIQQSVAEHNRQINALLALFCTRTTGFKTRYVTPGIARLQPLDESGKAMPIRGGGQYDLAFPLQMGGAAWGGTFVAREKMTVQEANDNTVTLISADMRWMRDHILAALFANASWTFTDDLHGSLTIKGLANSDTDTYQVFAGADAGATDTHYLAQSAAIADATNPFPTLYAELVEHPDNGGEVVCLIPTNLKATAEALATFHDIADQNIRPGNASAVLVGGLGVATPGKLIGYADKCWVVEWRSLPDNYILAVTTDGERALALREDEEESLRGFRQVAQEQRYPFQENQWIRRAGLGGNNRVGAAVCRIGNSSYAVPTGYGSPMP